MTRENTISEFPPPGRSIYCNRTLNLKSIRAVGYDMDYTLVHYKVDEWEGRAYEHYRAKLMDHGMPVKDFEFRPDFMLRGLIFDLEQGNILKANRFGFVKRAFHGTRPLNFEEQRNTYARTVVDPSEDRFVFANTLFSLSEGWTYAQLVDLLDQGKLPEALEYAELYRLTKSLVDEAHMEGQLKAEVAAAPDRFVALDSETPLALLDQKRAGKKLLLITNSEWGYTCAMMAYAFDRYLPEGMKWRDLFDIVIVRSRKPQFFSGRSPFFEVVTEEGLLKPCIGGLRDGGNYLGGNAGGVERHLGLAGEEILYVGDHVFSDIHVSKSVHRWRTALVIRELESELEVVSGFRADQERLTGLMADKERLEYQHCQLRLQLQRKKGNYGPRPAPDLEAAVGRKLSELSSKLNALDDEISPLARAAGQVNNPSWGLLMRAGNDKSYFARQVEGYSDIYTSRVSNFLYQTPFAYFRSPRGSLPHDPGSSDDLP